MQTADPFDFDMDDLAEKMAAYPSLGPNYEAGRIIAERFMAQFQEQQFRSLIDKFAGEFQDRLWSDLEASLLSDTESNLAGTIWRRVEATVEALLSGKEWALRQYVTDKKYSDGEEIRAAIAKHIPKELQDAQVADRDDKIFKLENENKRLREMLYDRH